MKKLLLSLILISFFSSCTSNNKLKSLLATEKNGIKDSVLQIISTEKYDPNLYYQSEHRGKTSFLSWAIQHPEIFKKILENGANPNQVINDRGHSILNTVFLNKSQILLMLNYDLKLPGNSPLSGALLLKNKWTLDELKTLAKHGLDLGSKSPKGETVLMRQWGFHSQDEISYLTQHVNINALNNKGMTALMIAVDNKNKEYVQLLLDAKADIHFEGKDGKTALHYCHSSSMAKLLQSNGALITPR